MERDRQTSTEKEREPDVDKGIIRTHCKPDQYEHGSIRTKEVAVLQKDYHNNKGEGEEGSGKERKGAGRRGRGGEGS